MFSKEDKDANHFKQLRDQTVSKPFANQHRKTNHTTGAIKSPPNVDDVKSTGENFIFRERKTIHATIPPINQIQPNSHPRNASKTLHENPPQQQLEHYNARQQHIQPPSKVGIIPIVPSTMQYQSQDNPNINDNTKNKAIKHQTKVTQYHLSQREPQQRVKFDLSKNEIKILEAKKTPSVLTVQDVLSIQDRISRENQSISRHPGKATHLKFSQLSSNQQKPPDQPWSYAEMTTKNLVK